MLSYATQAERVAALKAQDEALWALPDVALPTQQKVMDFLQRYKVWIIVGSLGLFALTLFRRRR
jgi:hypothetical protein